LPGAAFWKVGKTTKPTIKLVAGIVATLLAALAGYLLISKKNQ
jgi:hypothetical protein